VTDDLDHQVRQALQRRRRSPSVLLYVCIVAAIAGASGYLWLNYDSLAKLAFAERPPAAPMVDSSERGVTQKDFEALTRQLAESLQSTIENIDAQKAELKRLSDQVTALAAKVDALQSASQTADSLSGELRPGPQQPVVPARPPVIAARKKPPAPTTNGPISIGGAPLLPGPSAGQ
jgi:phage shock protein A